MCPLQRYLFIFLLYFDQLQQISDLNKIAQEYRYNIQDGRYFASFIILLAAVSYFSKAYSTTGKVL